MGLQTLPDRANAQTITEDNDWFNIFKEVMTVELAPRNSSGAVGAGVSDLGDASNYWDSAFGADFKLRSHSGKYLTVQLNPSVLADLSNVTTNYAKSLSCGYSVLGGTPAFTDVPNLFVTLQTTGNPVLLLLVDDGANGTEGGGGTPFTGSGFQNVSGTCFAAFFRDGLQLTNQKNVSTGAFPPGIIKHIDFPPVGKHIYKLQVSNYAVNYCRLFAIELIPTR